MDIKRYGVRSPILLDEDGRIEDGIHRMFACWLLSWEGDIPTGGQDPSTLRYIFSKEE
jgi:hypothetical protein